ncbi:hypothetical protein H0H93_014434 [Arthromyces matolae]|nr:hypothetical protein H0H93_014434 [Arthromyces matolae]
MGESTTLAVHRCRFVDYAPSAITALAFPPLPLPSISKKGKTPSTKQPLGFGTLAVGHANGNIDLYEWAGEATEQQSSQAWVLRKTLPGLHPSKVDSLAFAIRYPDDLRPEEELPSSSSLRLFSSGGGSELLEWDMDRACVKRSIGSQGGSIWCISANPASSLLALGCEDGTVRLISIVNDTLTHYRRFDRVKCRVLSIAWGPPTPKYPAASASNEHDSDSDEEDDHWQDSWLVTGSSDSSVRKWDIATGRVVDRMGTDKIRGERTLVWTVGVLGDGTIVSGDSLGMVKFWDSRTCTQLQSFQGHGADVLCLAIGPEGTTVFTSGVDQKVTLFSLVNTGQTTRTWVQSCSRRLHSHDVRALATWPPYTPLPPPHARRFSMDVSPILASGGLDMSVVVTPAALPSTTVIKAINPLMTSAHCTFEDSYHRRIAYSAGASGISAIQMSRRSRLITCLRDSGVSVWRIKDSPSSPNEDEDSHGISPAEPNSNSTGWEKVLEMDLNVNTNLIASGISDDGRWLVVSDLYESKLFSLVEAANNQLQIHRIREFSSIVQAHLPSSSALSTGSQAFQFTPDSSKLVMSTAASSFIFVIDLTGERPRILRRFDQHRFRDARSRVIKGRKADDDVEMEDTTAEPDEENAVIEEGSTSAVVNILRMAVSADGQWLATSDDSAQTHIFNLDSIQHHSVLPSFSKPLQVLAFDPRQPDILIMAFPDNSVQIYNVETRQFPAWGKEICTNLPKRFSHAHDPVLGVTFDVTSAEDVGPRYAYFWGSTWICKLSFSDLAPRNQTKKRRRESAKLSNAAHGDDAHTDFKMVTHYRPILFVDFIANRQLVVVERPVVDVLSTLPPAYFKHKYGAS